MGMVQTDGSKTTNNRMERMAASKGLELLKRQGRVELTTDFQYVRKGITESDKNLEGAWL